MIRTRNSELGTRNYRERSSFAVPRSEFRAPRSAFTLLEVLLTMLIAGLVLAAIASAIHIHFRVVDAGRAEVEQAQLARVLLRRIADDLRTAVPLAESSNSSTAAADDALAAADSAAGGSSGGSTSTSGSTSTAGGAASNSTSTSGAAAAATSAATSAAATSDDESTVQPNFVGSQYELQLDVTRLPDAHQFAGVSSDAALSGAVQAADSLSDVKTVSYYLGAAASAATTNTDPFAVDEFGINAIRSGLIRRQASRAASAFAYSQGGGAATAHEQILAEEAVALEFRYYDGAQWLTDWDSSVNEALPVCVEIFVTLRSAAPGIDSDPLSLVAARNQPLERTYRLVVHLPAGEATSTESTSDTSATSETETTR